MSILLNPLMVDSLKTFARQNGSSSYERVFYDSLDIAAPDADFWLKGLTSFRDARNREESRKTLEQITSEALRVASNGDLKRYKKSVEYFNEKMFSIKNRKKLINKIRRWLWIIGAVLIAAIVIYLGITHPEKVLFFF